MGRCADLTGQSFGRLTVVGRVENTPRGASRWECICSCLGTRVVVSASNLKAGSTSSCGCVQKENLRCRNESRAFDPGGKRPSDAKLRELYLDNQKSTREIAEKYGFSQTAVREWLRKAGVEMRSRGEGGALSIAKNPDKWRELGHRGGTHPHVRAALSDTSPKDARHLQTPDVRDKARKNRRAFIICSYCGGTALRQKTAKFCCTDHKRKARYTKRLSLGREQHPGWLQESVNRIAALSDAKTSESSDR